MTVQPGVLDPTGTPGVSHPRRALVLSFAGARPRGDVLELDPRLPVGWELLECRVAFRGANLRVRVTAEETMVASDQAAQVVVSGAQPVTVGAHGHRWSRP